MGAAASCKFPLLDQWKAIVDKNKVAGFIDAILCSFSQIIFNDNSLSGIFMIAAAFCAAPQAGIGGLWCALIALLYQKVIKVDPITTRLGLLGFCPALTGSIVAPLVFPDGVNVFFFVFFGFAAIFCVTLNMALSAIFSRWDNSPLGLPFGITAVVFLAAGQNMANVTLTDFTTAHSVQIIDPSMLETLGFAEYIKATVAGVSQLIGGATIIPAILVGCALICASRIDFISALLAGLVSTAVALFFGIPVSPVIFGLYGYNAMLLIFVLNRAFTVSPVSYILNLIFAGMTSILASWLGVSLGLIGAVCTALPFSIIGSLLMFAAPMMHRLDFNAPKYWGVPETVAANKRADQG